jgi:hypothetical protein
LARKAKKKKRPWINLPDTRSPETVASGTDKLRAIIAASERKITYEQAVEKITGDGIRERNRYERVLGEDDE